MRQALRRLVAVVVAGGLAALVACEQRAATDALVPVSTARPTTLPAGSDGKVHLSDAQWKARLTPEQYYILRQHGTERPFDNAYDANHAKGTYVCAACGQELFTSSEKFDSGCGWPSFTQAVAGDKVDLVADPDGQRTEVQCSRCGGHLGHVFDDGPPPTGQRFCIDSAAVKFIPAAPPTTAPATK